MSYTGPDFVNNGPPAINATNLNGMVTELERCSVLGDETKDIRVGADGKTYSSAGNAVRSQFNIVNNEILPLQNKLNFIFTSSTTNASGQIVADNTRISSNLKAVKKGYVIHCDSAYQMVIRIYSNFIANNTSYLSSIPASGYSGNDVDMTPYEGKYFIITIRKVGQETSDISGDLDIIGSKVYCMNTEYIAENVRFLSESTGIDFVSQSDFQYASITSDGTISWRLNPTGYGNALTTKIYNADAKIKINSDDIMIRIVNYDDDLNFESLGPFYSKNGSAVSTQAEIVRAKGNFRIMLASYSLNDYKSFEEMLSGIEFNIISGDAEEDILIPFVNDYEIDVKISKNGNRYISNIIPQNHMIKIENGINVFMDPNGNDSNSGLDILHPVKTLNRALSITNVQTILLNPGTYKSGVNYNAGQQVTKEINMIGIGSVIFDNNAAYGLMFYRSCYFENIEFTNGNHNVSVFLGTTDRECTFYHCKATKSVLNNGFSISGNKCYMIECEASENAYDGFNYHNYNNVPNHAIEIDCIAYGNGTYNIDGVAGQSSNGSTTHDASFIVRLNGEYYACHGGIIADKESKSANYGCRAGISTVTNQANYPDRMSNYWSSDSDMYLIECESYGSLYDTAIVNNGHIYSDRAYPSNYIA